MSTRSSHPEDVATETARRCLEIYGADPAKWPEAARVDYADMIASPALADGHAEAEALDAALATTHAPAASDALKNSLLESFDALRKRRSGASASDLFTAAFAFGRFAPAGVAAGLIAFGAAIGIMTSSTTGGTTAPTASDYVEEAFVIAFAENEEEALWAEE